MLELNQRLESPDIDNEPLGKNKFVNTFASLRILDFRLLWIATLCMMGSWQMQGIAQGYLAYDLTNSAKILALVNAGWALPMLSLTLVGGVVADRFQRKFIIQISQAAYALICLLVAIAIVAEIITWYYLLLGSALQGLFFAFTGPARQAIIPQLVDKKLVVNAIALNSAAMSSMSLIAPGISGLLYAVLGPEGVYFTVTGLQVTAIVLVSIIKKPPSPVIDKENVDVPKKDNRIVSKNGPSSFTNNMVKVIIKDASLGIRYLKTNNIVLLLLSVMVVTVIFSTPFQFLLPVFVVDIYNLESEAFGLLVSASGLGSLIGSIGVAYIGRWQRGRLVLVGGFISGISLLLIAIIPYYLPAIVIMIFLGLGNVAPMALITGLIMENTENAYRGRMMSMVMFTWGLIPIGVIPLGISIDLIGGRITVILMSFMMLTSFSLIYLTQKRLRSLQ